jgi:nucleoside-diphosphate-sugar epimerase
MKVLLTGSTGFIGSHVLRVLLERRQEVTVLLREESNPWRTSDVLDHVTIKRGSLAHFATELDVLNGCEFDAVLHLAWKGVPGRDRFALEQFHENVSLMLHALEVARKTGARTFLSLGSQSEYGAVEGTIDEEAPLRPETHYAHAKVAAFRLLEQYCRLFDIRGVWLRLFSLYGPGETTPWLIPSLVESLCGGELFPMTACEQVRDYLHVHDAAEGIYAALAAKDVVGAYNLSSGQGIALREIVESIRDRVAPGTELALGQLPYREDQAMKLVGDSSRFQEETDWKPKISISEGLQETVDYLYKQSASKHES